MAGTPSSPPDPVRAAACPSTVILLAAGGYRVTWRCGSTKTVKEDSGEWPAVDMRVLESRMDDMAHHHHAHVPHRAKVASARSTRT